VASPGCGRTVSAGGRDPDRQAATTWRGQSPRCRCPTAGAGGVGPCRKPPWWSAERGSRSYRDRPRLAARASRLASATMKTSAPVGAPSPLVRGSMRTKTTRPPDGAAGRIAAV